MLVTSREARSGVDIPNDSRSLYLSFRCWQQLWSSLQVPVGIGPERAETLNDASPLSKGFLLNAASNRPTLPVSTPAIRNASLSDFDVSAASQLNGDAGRREEKNFAVAAAKGFVLSPPQHQLRGAHARRFLRDKLSLVEHAKDWHFPHQ
ncbi:unnamed protein product [Phytophthora lilii]|uniref:Unnamed protein product n=1 Tax=Phytophthora lilii TaxID=2077276 RepID=A0A9W6X0J0_9STRA|nr:unnamed protein product [Phytophthora lilii]